MNPVQIYGIKNCDTMKKAVQWLDRRKIAYSFHDYKKSGADAAIIKQAIAQHGWENVLNRRGTTWRTLPDNIKESMNAKTALTAALANPSLIRRPLLVRDGHIHLGFDEESYTALFAE